jgi:electron transport complex protein RnfC
LLVPIDAQPEALENIKLCAPSVAAGERLVDATGERAVLAPVMGRCVGRELVQLFDGSSVPAIALVPSSPDADGQFAPINAEQTVSSLPPHNKEDLPMWLARLAENGIAARRNRSPDLLGQLKLAINRPVDTVICNLLDADPTLPLSSALAANFTRELMLGISIVSAICGATRSWIIGDARLATPWLAGLRKMTRRGSIKLILLVNDYPQTDPTLLLYSLMNRRLRPGRLPVEQGVFVLDAAAAVAVARLALLGEKMLWLPIAVRDHVKQQTHFVIAPIGMSLADILKQLNITGCTILRGGDLLRDQRLAPHAVISPSELTVHVSGAEPAINPDPCIRCGWCVEACPTRVHPAGVLEAAQREDVLFAERAGIEACIECGICSYVCPSRLPLLQAARLMRERLSESAADVTASSRDVMER